MSCKWGDKKRINYTNYEGMDVGNPIKYLAYAIVANAINDYWDLEYTDLIYYKDDGVCVSRAELKSFFNSSWCDSLIGECETEQIIKMLNIREAVCNI